MSTKTREQSREVVLALLRTEDARALLAAALIVVTLTLTVHTKAGAVEEARRAVLFVGAPSVTVSSAREAGAISRSYAETASLESLLALGFSEERANRYVVDRALASVTEQPADRDETITAQAALEAGAIYLAQTGARPPGEAGPGSEGELASAGPVRPELGDGTVAPAEDPPADDTSTKDLAVASDAGDGGDLAHAGGPPDSPVAAYPGSSSDDPAALYPTSGGEEPLELISSFAPDTDAGEDFPEEDPPAEFETGPISAKEQVPTTLAGGQMEMPSPQHEPANEPADNGGDELAVVPEESPSEQDGVNAPIEATAPRPFPDRESSTSLSVEEPDEEQSPAILLPAEPTADEEAPPEAPASTEGEDPRDSHEFAIFPTSPDERPPVPAEASTPDGGDDASSASIVGVSISEEQTTEAGFENDAREQVATIVVGGEPGQGHDVTLADGEVQNETPRLSPEPARDGEIPRPDTPEPTDTTEAPPETKPEQETSPAEDAPDEGAPGENRPPDRQDDRASNDRPASGSEANDPQGNPRGEAVTSPPGGLRDDPGRVPAGPGDGLKDREPTHGGLETNARAPRDDADRHPRRPIDAPETMPRQPQVLSDSGTRRPGEKPAEDGTRRATWEEASREDAVEQTRLERARQERLAARERRTTRHIPAALEPTNTKSEIREHKRGLGRTDADGAADALEIPIREEDCD